MAKEPRPKGYPKLKNYKPSQFMNNMQEAVS